MAFNLHLCFVFVSGVMLTLWMLLTRRSAGYVAAAAVGAGSPAQPVLLLGHRIADPKSAQNATITDPAVLVGSPK